MNYTERPQRVELEKDIVINVLACDEEPVLADAHLAARTIDVSEHGMKVWLYVAVPERTRVALDVPGPGNFRLEGEVRWVHEGGEIRVGVLIDEHSADFEEWRQSFEATWRGADHVLH